MLGSFRNRRAGVLVWVLLGMLIIGLGGWGIGVSGGLIGSYVARVGDQEVDSADYARALDQELRALSGQIGRGLTMEEARQFGIDRMVLGRLVNDAALDGEAARLGLSTGDEAVRAQVLASPAFQGLDGKFDREAYGFALDRVGLSSAEFEELLRREGARELVAGGVQAAADLPASAALALLGYAGERRSFDWMRLDPGLLPEPVPAPTDAELEAWHAEHADRYTRPETQEITYASATPEALAAAIEIPEDELRAAYDAEPERYSTPERRMLDRIGFRTDAEAAEAKGRLDRGEIEFDALAVERGLTPADTDQGEVAPGDLEAEARKAVFGAEGPGIVGPVKTPLGPSIFRINAVLAASTTPFEEAREELARERALEQARTQIAEETAAIEDLLAGGATLEEIASETVMELGAVALNSETTGGLADDPAFREAAAGAEVGVETDLAELAGGRLVTLRVEAVEPPALIPLAEIRERVAADWTAARTDEALTALAEGYAKELEGGLGFAELAERVGRTAERAGPLTRTDVLPGTPPALIADVFAAEEGATVIRAAGDGVILARLDAVAPFDPAGEGNAAELEALRAQLRQGAADDVLALYSAALLDRAGVRLDQGLIDATLARFP
jgi:peptidyl-prolyl cis-trans isomerase D